MPSSKTLLRLAEQADRDADALEAEAANAREQARQLRAMAESAGTKQIFHTRSQKSSSVVNDMNAEAKLNMSRRRSDDPFVRALRAAKPKGYTQNGLAKKLKIPASLLSMYRSKQRQIPRARAEEIEALTGWKADGEHWPGGIVSGD